MVYPPRENTLLMNNNVPKLAFLLLFFISQSLSSQNIRVKGAILDQKSRLPISYANISVGQHTLGTCSNIEGKFIFNFPDSLKNCQAYISCIGYKNDTVPLNKVANNDSLTIYLEPLSYSIKEIDVLPKQLTAEEVLKNVIKNLKNNYNKKPYFMEGFIRDRGYNIRNNKSTRLTEAAINIEIDELSRKKYRDKVKIVEIRNSFNYSNLEGKLMFNVKKVFFGWDESNPVYRTIQFAEYTNAKTLKNLLKNGNYVFSISDWSIYEGEPIIIIKAREKYRKFLTKKYLTNKLYRLIKIYVKAENYAIAKTEYFSVMKVKAPFDIYLKNDTIASYSAKQYTQIGKYHYLRYAGYYGKIYDQPNGVDAENLYTNETELLINNIVTNKKGYERIKRKNLLKKDISLWDMEYEYHPEFWQNYNILLDKPLVEKAKNDLEYEVPLEQQFKSTGNTNKKD